MGPYEPVTVTHDSMLIDRNDADRKEYSPWISFCFVVSTEVKEKELEIDIFSYLD